MSLANIAHLISLFNVTNQYCTLHKPIIYSGYDTKTFYSMTIDPGPIDCSVLTEQVKHRFELLWSLGGQVMA